MALTLQMGIIPMRLHKVKLVILACAIAATAHAQTPLDPAKLTVRLRTDKGESTWCGTSYYVDVFEAPDTSTPISSRRYIEKPPVGHGPAALAAKGIGSVLVIGVVSVVTLGQGAEFVGNKLGTAATKELLDGCGHKTQELATDFADDQKAKLKLAKTEGRQVTINKKGEIAVLPLQSSPDSSTDNSSETPVFTKNVQGRVVIPAPSESSPPANEAH